MSFVSFRFFDRHTKLSEVAPHFNSGIRFTKLNQVHGADVAVLKPSMLDQEITADAAVTTQTDLALSVHTADCLALLAHGDGVIGACHAGWRGMSAGIIENWVVKMGTLGAKNEHIKVHVGPSIGICHFEVELDVAEKIISSSLVPVKFLEKVKKSHSDPKKVYIDLKALARLELRRLGIWEENIEISPDCTYCDPEKYFSYLRDGQRLGKPLGRLEAVIVKSQR